MIGTLMVVGMVCIGLAMLVKSPWLLVLSFMAFVAASVVDNGKSY